jgi:hypothetical protein
MWIRIYSSNYLLFADNLRICRSVNSIDDCKLLQCDMDSVQKRYLNNSMKVNISKTTVIFFTRKLTFFSMAFPDHSGPWSLIQFHNHFSQTVGLLGRVIRSSQGRYLNTGQHKRRINAYTHQTSCPE